MGKREAVIDPTHEELLDWIELPVTKYYMAEIRERIDRFDKEVHASLMSYELNQAALHNAGMDVAKELYELPGELIEEKKGEKDGG
jgi:hypothetical protein